MVMRGPQLSSPAGWSIFLAVTCLYVLVALPALAANLPDRAPVPRILRSADDPAVKPVEPDVVLPETAVPLPTEKPTVPSTPPESPPEGDPGEAPAPLPDPRSAIRPDPSGTMPEEELACRRRLTELGVAFEEEQALSDPAGCSIPYPLTISSLGTDYGLQPEGTMNCATAEAVARFAKDVVSPAASEVFGVSLKSINHASAYVCRPRAGTRKLSEHAFGNAFDIASFTLSDGTAIAVEPEPPEKNGRFLAKVREAACGPFKTVLGPGSNADHAEHIHLDLAPRRNGGTICE